MFWPPRLLKSDPGVVRIREAEPVLGAAPQLGTLDVFLNAESF